MKLDLVAFEVEGRAVTLGEACAGALLGGLLSTVAARVHDELAAETWCDDHEEGPDSARIQRTLDAWRSKRMLTAADQVRAWLERHELELDDLVAYIARKLALESVVTRIEEVRSEIEVGWDDVLPLLAEETAFDWKLPELILKVAARAVSDPEDPKKTAEARRAVLAEIAELGGREAIEETLEVAPATLDWLIEQESRFRVKKAALTTPAAMERELARVRRGLTKVEIVTARFSDESVALEVIATLRDDTQLWLERLAHDLGFPTERTERYVDELADSALAARLAVARTGDIFGPEHQGSEWIVVEVLGRLEPRATDPDVARRIEERLVDRALLSALERKIKITYVA